MRRPPLLSVILAGVSLGCPGQSPAPAAAVESRRPAALVEAPPPTASAEAKPAPPPNPLDLGSLHPAYAPLFEEGRRFAFHVLSESSHYDPDDKRADKNGSVMDRSEARISCVVKEVGERAGGLAAVLDCGEDGNQTFVMGRDHITPAGVYVATARGLFVFPFGEEPPADLAATRPLLPLPLRVTRVQKKDADGESLFEITSHADGTWCVVDDSMYGDASHDEVCFQPGRGLVRLLGGWDGGSSHYATFDLVAGR